MATPVRFELTQAKLNELAMRCFAEFFGALCFTCLKLVFFRSSYFSGGVFVALVPGTLALDLPILTLSRLDFLYLTVCDHIIRISLG